MYISQTINISDLDGERKFNSQGMKVIFHLLQVMDQKDNSVDNAITICINIFNRFTSKLNFFIQKTHSHLDFML